MGFDFGLAQAGRVRLVRTLLWLRAWDWRESATKGLENLQWQRLGILDMLAKQFKIGFLELFLHVLVRCRRGR